MLQVQRRDETPQVLSLAATRSVLPRATPQQLPQSFPKPTEMTVRNSIYTMYAEKDKGIRDEMCRESPEDSPACSIAFHLGVFFASHIDQGPGALGR
jgi:hypothetical protein